MSGAVPLTRIGPDLDFCLLGSIFMLDNRETHVRDLVRIVTRKGEVRYVHDFEVSGGTDF